MEQVRRQNVQAKSLSRIFMAGATFYTKKRKEKQKEMMNTLELEKNKK